MTLIGLLAQHDYFNALVFATGWVSQLTIMRCGFALNVMCIAGPESIVYLWW